MATTTKHYSGDAQGFFGMSSAAIARRHNYLCRCESACKSTLLNGSLTLASRNVEVATFMNQCVQADAAVFDHTENKELL